MVEQWDDCVNVGENHITAMITLDKKIHGFNALCEQILIKVCPTEDLSAVFAEDPELTFAADSSCRKSARTAAQTVSESRIS